MHFRSLLPIPALIGLVVTARCEDWKTTDGKTYAGVKVLKVEADAVTVIYKDGGALIPLASLPPDLQKRFNYDPKKAQAAAAGRANADFKSKAALAEEAQIHHQQQAAAYSQPEQSQPKSISKSDAALYKQRGQTDTIAADDPPDAIFLAGTFAGKTKDGIFVLLLGENDPYPWGDVPQGMDNLRNVDRVFLMNYPGADSLADGDMIEAIVSSKGVMSYQTVLGSEATLHKFDTVRLPAAHKK